MDVEVCKLIYHSYITRYIGLGKCKRLYLCRRRSMLISIGICA